MRRQVVTTLVVLGLIVPVMTTFAPASLLVPMLLMTLALFPITVENIYTNAIYGAQRYDITARTSVIKMVLDLAITVGAHDFSPIDEVRRDNPLGMVLIGRRIIR